MEFLIIALIVIGVIVPFAMREVESSSAEEQHLEKFYVSYKAAIDNKETNPYSSRSSSSITDTAPSSNQNPTLVTGTCIHCGKSIKVPTARSECYCQYCGNKMPTAAALGSPTMEKATISPFLRDWETDYGAAIFAYFIVLVQNYLVEYMSIIFFTAFEFATGALGIFYSLVIYPSYFKEQPIIRSNSLISFLNCYFGGICGVLWNSSLTKKQKGISYVVVAVCIALSMGYILYFYSTVL